MRGIFYGYLFWLNEIVKDPFATVIHFKIFYLTAIFNVSYKVEFHIGSCMVKIVKINSAEPHCRIVYRQRGIFMEDHLKFWSHSTKIFVELY